MNEPDRRSGFGNCLSDDAIGDFLDGPLEPALRTAYAEHLGACDPCRATLVRLMRIVRAGSEPEESREVDRIAQAWQAQVAIGPPLSHSRRTELIGGAVLCLLVAAALGAGWFLNRDSDSATAVIARIIEDDRWFEGRLADQPYVPFVALRNGGSVADPAVLDGMDTDQTDSYARGLALILKKEFSAAIGHLTLAAGNRADVRIRNDLAVALVEEGSAASLDRAQSELNAILGKTPGFPPALFNLALCRERQRRLPEARTAWERYLAIDSSSGWAVEAREHLEMLR